MRWCFYWNCNLLVCEYGNHLKNTGNSFSTVPGSDIVPCHSKGHVIIGGSEMANYGLKIFGRYRQLLCGVEGSKLPPCEQDIKDVIATWESDKGYYDTMASDYEKGIINFGAASEDTDDDTGVEQLQREADKGNGKAMNLCAMAHHLIALQGKTKLDKDLLNMVYRFFECGICLC